MSDFSSSPAPMPRTPQIGAMLDIAFAQPADQALPRDFLAMLARLDRAKRTERR